ncbi:MAG: hypothetical protein GX220_05085 [Treponema sp.]|nr:hypothetical protein [Treponema sp.]
MKSIEKYYNKIYKETNKVTKKLFHDDIPGCLKSRLKIKKEIELIIKKPIFEITDQDIIHNKIGYFYTKYRTLSKLMEILEGACFFKTFMIEEFENEKSE